MSQPPVSLRLFGGVALERDGRPVGGRATQRRRIGVLALLAAAPTGQASRDRLIAYLWPDAETDAARHLLAGAVYELRKALGEESILSRGDELALNPEVVASDATGFEDALAEGALDPAVALYRGVFADGLHISGAPEFERWLEETRGRYRSAYRKALTTLALARERDGARAEAADCWVRLADSDPADASVTQRAIQALDGAGQPARALRLSQLYVAHIRREFDGEPDARITLLADEIQRRHRPSPSRPADPVDIPPRSVSLPRPTRVARGRQLTLWTFVASAVLLLVALARHGGAGAEVNAPVARNLVVLPFERAPAAARDLATLLAGALDQAGPIRARTARDTTGGPSAVGLSDWYLRGSLVELTGELRLHVGLFRGPGGPLLAEADVVGDPARPAALVEELALALLTRWPRPAADRLSTVAAQGTRSLAALRAWLTGEREFRTGHFLAAAEQFARAAEVDSTFALASYRLSQASLAADLPEADVTVADRRVERLSVGLPERERLLLAAYTGFRIGHAEYAEQRSQGLTTRYPDDLEAWLQLGETRFHYGPSRGIPVAAAEEAFRRAAALDPSNWIAQWHLAGIAALEGRRGDLERALNRMLAMEPERSEALELGLLQALVEGDQQKEAGVLRELRDADELVLFQGVWRAAVFLRDLRAAERVAGILSHPRRPTNAQALGRLSLVHLQLAGGRPDSALAELKRASALPGVEDYARTVWVATMLVPGMRIDPVELRRLRDTVRQVLGSSSGRRAQRYLMLLGFLHLGLGSTDSAQATAQRLDQADAHDWALLLRADVASHQGRFEEALVYLRDQGPRGWYGNLLGSLDSFEARGRFLRAEALFRLGRLDQALGWYGSLGEHALADLSYLGPALERRGEIFERLGQPVRARTEYQRLAALRSR